VTVLSLEDKHTKDLIKQALLELFEERRDLFHALFEEAVREEREKISAMEKRFAEGYAKQPQTKEEITEWESEQSWGEA
jgi:hypothetical protein